MRRIWTKLTKMVDLEWNQHFIIPFRQVPSLHKMTIGDLHQSLDKEEQHERPKSSKEGIEKFAHKRTYGGSGNACLVWPRTCDSYRRPFISWEVWPTMSSRWAMWHQDPRIGDESIEVFVCWIPLQQNLLIEMDKKDCYTRANSCNMPIVAVKNHTQ